MKNVRKDTSWSIKSSGQGYEEKQYATRWNNGVLEILRPDNGSTFSSYEFGDMDADNAYTSFKLSDVINEG